MPNRLFRYVTDQHRQSRPKVAISRSVRGLAAILALLGAVAFLILPVELSKLGEGPEPYRAFVALMYFSCMVLFLPLAVLLYCCTLKRAGPLLASGLAAASVLYTGVWYELIGADSLQMTADTLWELRKRAYGLNCFSYGSPIGT